jgi:hypothetical protein
MKNKHTVKVFFEDGNSLITTINGTEKEIREYYINKCFANTREQLVLCVKIEFL